MHLNLSYGRSVAVWNCECGEFWADLPYDVQIGQYRMDAGRWLRKPNHDWFPMGCIPVDMDDERPALAGPV